MKILWIVNTIFPYPAKMLGKNKSVFGGWMMGLKESIEKNDDIKLAIATIYDGMDLQKYDDGKTIYYLLPTKNNRKYDSKLEKYWKEVCDDFSPDVVHIHGTEYVHALPLLRACKNIKTVTSIQGLVSLYGEVYLMNIDCKDLLSNVTLRDIIKRDSMLKSKNSFLSRTKYEKEILQRSNIVVGRTTWDYSSLYEFTDVNKYRFCNESLRDAFYNNNWDYNNVEKNTIFISQASYPVKGFHEMVKAIPIIKRKYPNVKLYVAGPKIINTSSFKDRLKMTGYAKYLNKLIKKYGVSENIEFVGLLDEKQMVERLLKCNVFVQTSVIENSPNSLGEAMLLGMPIVASNVGGTSDMLIDKKEGYLYPFGEKNLLAGYIIKIFDDSKNAIELGKNAKNHASKTHDREKNGHDMLEIYRSLNDEK